MEKLTILLLVVLLIIKELRPSSKKPTSNRDHNKKGRK